MNCVFLFFARTQKLREYTPPFSSRRFTSRGMVKSYAIIQKFYAITQNMIRYSYQVMGLMSQKLGCLLTSDA